MSNEIEIFKNEEFGEVRTIEVDGKVLFCGSDVAKALGYARPNDAMSAHCRGTVKYSIPHPQSPDKEIEMSFISEGEVYRLITRSKLPAAEKFERWLFDEVVPSIREHGAYMTSNTIEKALADPDFLIQLATQLKEERARANQLEAINRANKPKVEYFDSLIDRNLLTNFRDTAKELYVKQNTFINYLLDNEYVYRDVKKKLLPYAQHIEDGLFELKEYANKNNGQGGTQTLITPRGREIFRVLMNNN